MIQLLVYINEFLVEKTPPNKILEKTTFPTQVIPTFHLSQNKQDLVLPPRA